MGAFAANDALVKLVAQRYPLGEVIFVRGLITTAMLGAVMAMLSHAKPAALAAFKDSRTMARAVLEGFAAALFTSTLLHMPIAEASAIILISPLILTGMAVLLYKEEVGARRWAAIALGFAGMLLIAKPAPGALNPWALVALLCAFVAAGRDLITRNIDPRIPALGVSLTAAVSVTLFGLVMGWWESWRVIDPMNLGLLVLTAAFLALGNYLLVLAFRGVEISVVAPYRYTLLIWASLSGLLLFGETPDLMAITGAAMIAASGVYALHRERVRARKQTAKAELIDAAGALRSKV